MRRRCYQFGPYRLDPTTRTMLRDDKPVALTPKAVETLAVLIENRNEVVSKEVLANRVWPGTFVGDGSLMRNISDLRRALSEWDAACIDTIPRRGYRFNAGVTEVNHGQSSGRRSIAVLPFQFPQGNARDRAVAASIVEAIITKLSSVRECDVRPSGGVAQAEFVLHGSIRRHRDKARVSVRLLPSNGDPPLWSETIEETYADPFEFEDSISDELAGATALILTTAERKLLSRRYTEKTAAYQAYLKGRLQWARRSEEGLHRAIEHFRRAIDIDHEYAVAHSALGSSFALLPMLAPVASSRFMPRAKAAAIRALDIDDLLIEARSVLAFAKWHYDWNWSGAERELRRILRFAPDDAVSRVWYALLLAERGQSSKAVEQARRAESLDPDSPSIRANIATVMHFCGRFDDAIEETTNAIAGDATSLRAHYIYGLALEQTEHPAEAVAALERATVLSRGTHATTLGALGHAYARAGRRDDADRVLRQLDELPQEVNAVAKGLIRIALGEHSEALRELERAFESREFYLIMLGVDRRLDPLRHRPGFRTLVERVGLA